MYTSMLKIAAACTRRAVGRVAPFHEVHLGFRTGLRLCKAEARARSRCTRRHGQRSAGVKHVDTLLQSRDLFALFFKYPKAQSEYVRHLYDMGSEP